jgi:hypothetical protein
MPEKRPQAVILLDLLDVAGGLSPENLEHDGEATKAEIRRDRAALNRQWRELQTELGRRITPHEVECWADTPEGKAAYRAKYGPSIRVEWHPGGVRKRVDNDTGEVLKEWRE